MAGNKKVLSSDLENVGQGQHTQIAASQLLYERFYQTFIEMNAESSAINIDSVIFY